MSQTSRRDREGEILIPPAPVIVSTLIEVEVSATLVRPNTVRVRPFRSRIGVLGAQLNRRFQKRGGIEKKKIRHPDRVIVSRQIRGCIDRRLSIQSRVLKFLVIDKVCVLREFEVI